MGGNAEGMTTGTTRIADPFAARKIWLSQTGIDNDYAGYMERSKAGLTVLIELIEAPRPTDYESNFWPIWPEGYDDRIQDPIIAERVGHAMKQDWEKAVEHERLAANNRKAILNESRAPNISSRSSFTQILPKGGQNNVQSSTVYYAGPPHSIVYRSSSF